MNRKVVAGLVLLVLVGISAGFIISKRSHTHASVTATIRISVSPAEKLDYVVEKARSPFFKYLMTKKTGIKPSLAQRLEVKQMPGSPSLEATIGVESSEEGRKYVAGFVETLQDACGKEAQVTMVDSSVR